MASYYIIEGTIYQSPSLGAILANRLVDIPFNIQMTSQYFLNKAFQMTMEQSRFHPMQGYRWISEEEDIEKRKKELKDLASDTQLMTVDLRMKTAAYQSQLDRIIMDSLSVKSHHQPPIDASDLPPIKRRKTDQ